MITFATEASRRRFAEGLIQAAVAGLAGLTATAFAVEYVRARRHLESAAQGADTRAGGEVGDELPTCGMFRAPSAADIAAHRSPGPEAVMARPAGVTFADLYERHVSNN